MTAETAQRFHLNSPAEASYVYGCRAPVPRFGLECRIEHSRPLKEWEIRQLNNHLHDILALRERNGETFEQVKFADFQLLHEDGLGQQLEHTFVLSLRLSSAPNPNAWLNGACPCVIRNTCCLLRAFIECTAVPRVPVCDWLRVSFSRG